MMTRELEAAALSPALGAAIHGLDLTRPLEEGERAFLRKAWAEHLVLVIHNDAPLSAEVHMDFCGIFGEIGARARPTQARHEPEGAPQNVMYVSNKRENGRIIGSIPDGEMEFHIDQSYMEVPAKAGCLHGLELPAEGGDTIFGNLCLAYEALPDDLRRAVEGRRAVTSYGHGGYGIQTRNANDHAAATRRASHPIVCTHPDNGRRVLYVNRLMTERIEGLPDDESEDLLFRLFAHQEQAEFLYVHKWRRYDLLLWDNRACIHARTDFDPAQTRHLRRFSIRGHALT